MKNKIVVLGSNSFAGSQLVDCALNNGHSVVGINRSVEQSELFLPYKKNKHSASYDFHQLDVNNDLPDICELLNAEKPNIIVDLAGQGMVAESWDAPEQWYQTNVVSKVKLHQFLLKKPWLDKYVRVSTPEVYGSQQDPISESKIYHPSTPYAVSHSAIDMSLDVFHKQYKFPVIFTRFSNFYGPGQQLYRIIPRTIIYALTGKTLQLHGGGTSVRAFIHGRDVGNALLKSADNGKIGEVYHFSTSEFISICDLVKLIFKQLDLPFEKHVEVVADRPGKDANYLMNDSKAQQSLSWSAQIELETGIAETIAWVKKNLAEIQTLPLSYQHKI